MIDDLLSNDRKAYKRQESEPVVPPKIDLFYPSSVEPETNEHGRRYERDHNAQEHIIVTGRTRTCPLAWRRRVHARLVEPSAKLSTCSCAFE